MKITAEPVWKSKVSNQIRCEPKYQVLFEQITWSHSQLAMKSCVHSHQCTELFQLSFKQIAYTLKATFTSLITTLHFIMNTSARRLAIHSTLHNQNFIQGNNTLSCVCPCVMGCGHGRNYTYIYIIGVSGLNFKSPQVDLLN